MTTTGRKRRARTEDADDRAPDVDRRRRREPSQARAVSRRRRPRVAARRLEGRRAGAQGLRGALWGDSWRSPQRGIAASSTLALVGLALLGLGPSELGAALTLVGTVGLMASLHRFGRLGPDEERLGA